MSSAAKLKAATRAPDSAVSDAARRGAALYTHNLLMDAADALKALARGDDCAADASLKLVLIACADARSALQPAMLPPPRADRAQVDSALEEWMG